MREMEQSGVEVCVRVREFLPLFFFFSMFSFVFVELAGKGIWDDGFKVLTIKP